MGEYEWVGEENGDQDNEGESSWNFYEGEREEMLSCLLSL